MPRQPVFLFVAGLLVLGILAIACGDDGGENDEATALVVLGGVPIPEEGPPTEGGFAFEGEDVVSPGPAITVRAAEPVTITFKIADEIVPEPHDFVIVAGMGLAPLDFGADTLEGRIARNNARLTDPLWGAETEQLPFGEQQSITFTPDTPGSHFYICSVSDHLSRGMWGSFIVEE